MSVHPVHASNALCGMYCALAALSFEDWERAAILYNDISPAERKTVHALAVAASGRCMTASCLPSGQHPPGLPPPGEVTITPLPGGGVTEFPPIGNGGSPTGTASATEKDAAAKLAKIICTPEKVSGYGMALNVLKWLHTQVSDEAVKGYLVAMMLFLEAVIMWCNISDPDLQVAALKAACLKAKLASQALGSVPTILKWDLALLDVFQLDQLMDDFMKFC